MRTSTISTISALDTLHNDEVSSTAAATGTAVTVAYSTTAATSTTTRSSSLHVQCVCVCVEFVCVLRLRWHVRIKVKSRVQGLMAMSRQISCGAVLKQCPLPTGPASGKLL